MNKTFIEWLHYIKLTQNFDKLSALKIRTRMYLIPEFNAEENTITYKIIER